MPNGPGEKNFENSGQAHDADIDAIYGSEDAPIASDETTEESEVEDASEKK